MTEKAVRDAKRIEALGQAIDEAADRCKGKRTVLVLHSVDFIALEYEAGPAFVLSPVCTPCSSCRVGRNPSDKYFRIKLIPELRTLALPLVGRCKDDGSLGIGPDGVAFVATSPKEINALYRPFEVREIIELLRTTEAV